MNASETIITRIARTETVEEAQRLAARWLVDNGVTEFCLNIGHEIRGERDWHNGGGGCGDVGVVAVLSALLDRVARG